MSTVKAVLCWIHDCLDSTHACNSLRPMLARVFWLVLVDFVLRCLKASHQMEKCLNFDGLSNELPCSLVCVGKKQFGSTSP